MEINKLYQGDTVFRGEDFDLENFKRFLHYPDERTLPENISGFLDTSLLPVLPEHPVSEQYRIVPIMLRNAQVKQVELVDKIMFTGPIIYNLLAHCDYAVVHILSTQSDVGRDDMESFVSYCFYNTLIQTSSDQLRNKIVTELGIRDAQLTQRYAPGYCGWPIQDQKSIFDLLDPAALGVTLDDTMTLQPAHTITGIYGVRKTAVVREQMPCYTCTSISCGVHYDFAREIAPAR
jgi:hypothetical protein